MNFPCHDCLLEGNQALRPDPPLGQSLVFLGFSEIKPCQGKASKMMAEFSMVFSNVPILVIPRIFGTDQLG